MHARPPQMLILDHHYVYFSLLAPVIQMSWKTIASQNWNAHCEESIKMINAWKIFFIFITNYLVFTLFSSNLTFLACYVIISIVLWPFVKSKVWSEWCTQTWGINTGGTYTSQIQSVITTEIMKTVIISVFSWSCCLFFKCSTKEKRFI